MAGEEFLTQFPDDSPLLRAGVLRLVNEDVVDAAVEFVHNPRCGATSFKQMQRIGNQIVVIENAAFTFEAYVFVTRGSGDCQSGRRERRRARRAAALFGGKKFLDKLEELIMQKQIGPRVRLADKLLARFRICGQENPATDIISIFAGNRRCQGFGQFPLFFWAAGKPMHDIGEILSVFGQFSAELPRNVFALLAYPYAVGICDGDRHSVCVARKALEVAFEFATIPAEREIEQRPQLAVVRVGSKTCYGFADRLFASGRALENAGARLADQFARGSFVENLERRRDARLERKASEEILAKRVDGLDFEPPGRFECEREQAPRALQAAWVATFRSDFHQSCRKRCVIERRPFAELCKQTSRHLGGGSFCVRQAQDFLGSRSIK